MNEKSDIKYMQIALNIAKRGVGMVAPNPSVGCVVVKNNQIISTGRTANGGRPHAESIALKNIDAKGATLYVTLEPCCHHGKTAPCVEAIIKAGLAKVVIATKDPFVKVAGGGIKALQNAGVEVVLDVCEGDALKLNEGFFAVQLKGRPYVTLKLATSSDGKIAENAGVRTKITGEEAQNYAHYLRAKNDAIMVGIDTVLADNPQLTCRLPGLLMQSPIRVVVDSNLRIPDDCHLLKSAKEFPLYILSVKDGNKAGANVVKCKSNEVGRVDLQDALQILAKQGVTRLLVEGGSKLAASLIEANLVDELIWIKSPNEIGEGGVSAIDGMDIKNLQINHNLAYKLGNDIVIKHKFDQ